MNITDLIKPADIYLDADLASKKDVLRFLSERVSEKCGSRANECRNALMAREKLGSTAIGDGIAFPHAQLDGLDRAMAIFVRPAQAVPFAATDDSPVDLIMMLLTPTGAAKMHLDGIATLARLLRSADTVRELRAAQSAEDVVAAFGG
jgi:PTS system nitrogen regulatory IIA component